MFRNLTYERNQSKKPSFLKQPKHKIIKSRKFGKYSTTRPLHKSWVRGKSAPSSISHNTNTQQKQKDTHITPKISRPKPVCKYFMRGQCYKDDCSYSHTVPEHKRPFCMRFIRGVCVDDKCPYLHVKVNPKAKVCPFFLKGRCPFGRNCKDKHVMVSKSRSLSYKRKTGGDNKNISSSSSTSSSYPPSHSLSGNHNKVASTAQSETLQILPMFNTLPDSLN